MGKASRRALITDTSVARLALAKDEAGYVVRDRDVRGFIVKVGMRRKTYRYEGEQRNGNHRKVISRKLGEHPHTKAGDARAAALDIIGQRARGESLASVSSDITMLQAWTRYEVYLKKENRSSRTIDDYRQKFEKHLALWHGTPLRKITRAEVLTWHGKVTKDAGAYAANGAARLGHALFAYARDELEAPDMPGRNPFRGKGLHNEEQPRETGMGTRDIRPWLDELLKLQSPILREFHWLSLLSGLRRNDVATLRWSDVSILERAITLRAPKGGKKRRFRAPLSHAMLRSLCRARIAGRVMHDRQSHEWVFPAASRSGHVEEIKGTSWVDSKNGDKRKIVRLSKVGHSLRHSYRTLCAAAGLDRLRTKLLMNHQVSRDVTDAYLSTPALFDQLREAQRTVSDLIVRSAGQDPDERLTRLLLSEVRGGSVSSMVSPAHSAVSRNQARPIESKGGVGRHQPFKRDHRRVPSPSTPSSSRTTTPGRMGRQSTRP
jgi:integrase